VVEIEIIVVGKLSLCSNKTHETPPKKVRSVHYAHILLYAFNETAVDVKDGKYIFIIIYYITLKYYVCIYIKYYKMYLTADNGLRAQI